MTAERWTVRGIAVDLQRAVADAARQEGRSVGGWLSAALRDALERQPAGPQQAKDAELSAVVARLAERLAAVEARLAGESRQMDGSQTADSQSTPTPSSGRTNDSQTAVTTNETVPDDDALLSPGALKSKRQAFGWGQRKLAAVSGVPQSEISKFEAGKRSLKPEVLARLADILGNGDG